MKTIEVINNKLRKTDVFLSISAYKYNGDTLVLFDDKGHVLRTYLPEEFTGFKVNASRPLNLPTQ